MAESMIGLLVIEVDDAGCAADAPRTHARPTGPLGVRLHTSIAARAGECVTYPVITIRAIRSSASANVNAPPPL
jgi:hypothetical protein